MSMNVFFFWRQVIFLSPPTSFDSHVRRRFLAGRSPRGCQAVVLAFVCLVGSVSRESRSGRPRRAGQRRDFARENRCGCALRLSATAVASPVAVAARCQLWEVESCLLCLCGGRGPRLPVGAHSTAENGKARQKAPNLRARNRKGCSSLRAWPADHSSDRVDAGHDAVGNRLAWLTMYGKRLAPRRGRFNPRVGIFFCHCLVASVAPWSAKVLFPRLNRAEPSVTLVALA